MTVIVIRKRHRSRRNRIWSLADRFNRMADAHLAGLAETMSDSYRAWKQGRIRRYLDRVNALLLAAG